MPQMTVYLSKSKAIPVADYAEASVKCRAYIDARGLGNSAWSGGLLLMDGDPAGHVSYNGRVWPGLARDWKPGIQPIYDPYAKS